MKKQLTLRLEQTTLKELQEEATQLGVNVQTYITILINKRNKGE